MATTSQSLLLLLVAVAVAAAAGSCSAAPPPPPLCPRSELPFLYELRSICPAWIERAPPVEVTGDVLDKVLSSGHESFPYAVLFYASWCPFSRDIRPTFSALSSMFPQMSHLAVEESSAMPSVFSRYGVHSFPSILIMNQTTKVRYHGPKDLRSLVRFYKETTGVNPVAYLEDDQPRSSGNSRSLWPWDGSLRALIANEPYLAFSLIFLCMKLIIKFFPKIISCIKSLWISYAWHVNLGIFDESRQLLERARHIIDLKKLWNKLRLGSKARNFQNGANNARVWARLP